MINIIKDALAARPQKMRYNICDHKSLTWLFFSHQGRRHCSSNKHPLVNLFREKKQDVNKYGVFVDAGDIIIANDTQVGLIGETTAILFFTDNSKVYKIILMHGAKAKIVATNSTVILLANMDECQVEIEKDESVIIL